MTSALTVRRPPFTFADGVRFNWQPDNPAFGQFLNSLSFLFVGFEKYIIKVMRDAMPLIDDPDVKVEARLFLEQEAQHSVAHNRHIDALIALYPGLRETLQKAIAHFDQLYQRESTQFHLAYIADLEATFTPTLRFAINYREPLFAAGDANIASLFLWHAVEEIEHRSSAFAIYNDVVGSNWFRLSKLAAVGRHLKVLFELLDDEFARHIPREELVAGRRDVPPILGRIPSRAIWLLRLHVIACLLPWHDPARERIPPWFFDWMQADQAGEDMTRFYGVKPPG